MATHLQLPPQSLPQIASIENTFFSMAEASLSILGFDRLSERHRELVSASITEFGCGVAEMLTYLKPQIALNEDDVVLTLPLPMGRTIEEARKILHNTENSYHLFRIGDFQTEMRILNSDYSEPPVTLRFRISTIERKKENKKDGSGVRETVKVKNTPAKFLQGLLVSWLRFSLPRVPKTLRTGVYQKVAESLNSFFSLYYEGDAAGKQASFPSLDERRPEVRSQMYRTNLEALCKRTIPLEYRTVREIYPGEYKPDDPRGNRLVCVSDDWLRFVERPFPGRFPAFFVNQGGKPPVVIYEHRSSSRFHAFLPLLTADEGPLVRQPNDTEINWWFVHRDEFRPLSLFEKPWPKSGTGIMVPLDYDSNPHQPDRVKIQNVGSHAQFNRDKIVSRHESKGRSAFAELRRQIKHRRSHKFKPKGLVKPLRHQGQIERLLRSGLGIGTVLLKEFRSMHPNRKENNGSRRSWKLQFALEHTNQIPLQTRTMGVHFGDKPVIYWQIHGTNIHGSFDWSVQIERALASQAELEKDQRRSRSTANRSFSHENRAWVRDVARGIVRTAKEHGCSLAREVVKYVPQKHSGDSVLNRRFSMWCFSDLGAAIDHQCNKEAVFSVEISDYDVKFTCPNCGAIRKAGQTPEEATTYLRKDGMFVCRPCGFSEPVRPEIFAENCASVGARKVAERIRRIQEKLQSGS